MSSSGFETIDFIIFGIYIVVLVTLGLFLSRDKDGKEKSANDYFLAGNTLTWWAVGASLIAANISAEQFIGMSGTGFADGIAIAAYEVMAAITLVVIGKLSVGLGAVTKAVGTAINGKEQTAMFKKTKIICTMGPACDKEETLKALIQNGMNVARFNFSHGTYEWHAQAMNRVRRISDELDIPVAILLDTKGPEIRTGLVEDDKIRTCPHGRPIIISFDKKFIEKEFKRIV